MPILLRLPATAACLTLAASLFVGCQAPDPKPFDQFATAIAGLKGGADATLDTEATIARARYEKQVLSSTDGVSTIFLTPDPTDPYAWKPPTKPILYLEVAQLKTGLAQLNDVFSQYATLLAQLAGSDLIKQEDFDKLATDLNANVSDALKSLPNKSVATAPAAVEGVALFSVAAAEAMHAYIEHKRTTDLIKVLTENQTHIQDFATKGRNAIKLVALDWQVEYTRKKLDWDTAYSAAQSDDAKREVVEKVMWENDNYMTTLATLRSLDTAYNSLPAAHQELLDSLTHKQPLLARISFLLAEVKHLQTLYSQLKPTDS